MRNGQVPWEKYVITKTLTKPSEAYPDAKHVLVSPICFHFCYFKQSYLYSFAMTYLILTFEDALLVHNV